MEAPPVQNIQKIELYSGKYYLTCAYGGILACGLTHTLVTPLDLVKCRRQVDTKLYKGNFDGWSKIYRTSGVGGLYTGWLPTFIGYSFQGAAKYGFYEVFKKKYSDLAGEETAFKYRTGLYLAASASAEIIADIALCPWEALKVRMQTSTQPFASSTAAGFNKILKAEGLNGFYKGLTPLWSRQVPYTMMKFASFEKTVEIIYQQLGKPKEAYNKLEQLGVSFLGGYIAGVFCAIVSHPADTVVSKLNNISKAEGDSTFALTGRILKDLGFLGVWRGLGTRVIMIGTLTALQWLIYDYVKVYAGLPTTGSSGKKKKLMNDELHINNNNSISNVGSNKNINGNGNDNNDDDHGNNINLLGNVNFNRTDDLIKVVPKKDTGSSYITETQDDDIQWLLYSYGLDLQDDVERLIYEIDDE